MEAGEEKISQEARLRIEQVGYDQPFNQHIPLSLMWGSSFCRNMEQGQGYSVG